MSSVEKTYNRNLLLAVDESDNSRRAVSYVAQVLNGVSGFKVILLHILQSPDEDFFSTAEDRHSYYSEYRETILQTLDDYRQILIDSGFDTEDVSISSPERYCPSLAECILSEQAALSCSTIVVGRKGVSRKEEFLFGSVSSKIVTHAENCTIWVVE